MLKSKVRLSESIFVGPQINAKLLDELIDSGIKSVVNLCSDREYQQNLKPHEEEELVREKGLQYMHAPFTLAKVKPPITLALVAEINQLPGPVYIHCLMGQRSTPIGIICNAVQKDLTIKQAFEDARESGLQWKAPVITVTVEHTLRTLEDEEPELSEGVKVEATETGSTSVHNFSSLRKSTLDLLDELPDTGK